MDIRETVPRVAAMVAGRQKHCTTAPPPETLTATGLVLAEYGEAFEENTREGLLEDVEVLEKADVAAGDPLPEGTLKDRAYRLYGRLAQLLRLPRIQDGSIIAARESAAQAVDAVSRMLDYVKTAEVFWKFIRWLMM